MKRIVALLFTISFFSTSLFSQPAYKISFSLARKLKNESIQNKEIAVFVRGNISEIEKKTKEVGGVFKYAAGDIAAIRLPLNKVNEIAALKSVTRIEDNDLKLQPMNDRMIVNSKVYLVQNGVNLPQGYDGTHVVVGIIDEGIDPTHPDFRDISGHTRIKYTWDQSSGPTGISPQPYGYGREWIGNQIDTSTAFADGPASHGSHVAGVACGNGLAVNNYKGVAPNCDIIIVKMDLNTQSDDNFLTSLVDAVKYIYDKADLLNEPASINVSLGTYFGSHDAKDIQAVAIDTIIAGQLPGGKGRSLTCAAGNAGSAPIHLGYDITDTAITWLFAPHPTYIEIWSDSADFANVQFTVGLDRVAPFYSYLGGLPFSNIQSHLGPPAADTLYMGTSRLGIIESQGEFLHGGYKMAYLITPDSISTSFRWRLMTKGTGHLDAWCYDMVADNLPDSTTFPLITKYKRPDTDQNIASSFTCSDKVITVGSYANRNSYANALSNQTVDGSIVPGRLSSFSSHGPTRDGRIKPDVNSTGEWVLSCGAQNFLNSLVAVEPTKVAAGRKHFRSNGTSHASPVVAGIAALYLQKNPTATYADVKNAILDCADQDGFTGSFLPNNFWGHGKANAYATVYGCSVGIRENEFDLVELSNFPNPFMDETSIHYDLTSYPAYKKAMINVSDMIGHTILSFSLSDRSNNILISKSKLRSGVYFYSVVVDGKILKTNRLVVL